MKKKLILLSVLLIIFASCFIPYRQQKTIVIKASFYNVYQELRQAKNWEKWRSDLRGISNKDSSKISDIRDSAGFEMSYAQRALKVAVVDGYSFLVNDNDDGTTLEYAYTVLPGKFADQTTVIATQRTNVLNYILNTFEAKRLPETHIADLKNYMEDPALYYGYEIDKKKVTDTDIIVLRELVLAKNKFTDAAKNLNILKNYIRANGLKQTQPLIAQFFGRSNDSVQLNIGIPVNKKSFTKKPIDFMDMPKTGYVYTVKFHGRFADRHKAYAAGQKYFHDRGLQVPILPFETYAGDRLPLSDTDYVNIRINFPTY